MESIFFNNFNAEKHLKEKYITVNAQSDRHLF